MYLSTLILLGPMENSLLVYSLLGNELVLLVISDVSGSSRLDPGINTSFGMDVGTNASECNLYTISTLLLTFVMRLKTSSASFGSIESSFFRYTLNVGSSGMSCAA